MTSLGFGCHNWRPYISVSSLALFAIVVVFLPRVTPAVIVFEGFLAAIIPNLMDEGEPIRLLVSVLRPFRAGRVDICLCFHHRAAPDANVLRPFRASTGLVMDEGEAIRSTGVGIAFFQGFYRMSILFLILAP